METAARSKMETAARSKVGRWRAARVAAGVGIRGHATLPRGTHQSVPFGRVHRAVPNAYVAEGVRLLDILGCNPKQREAK
jgi:hypothetical protein